MRFYGLMVSCFVMGTFGVVNAEENLDELRCGTSKVGDTCLTHGRKGTCKRTKCCKKVGEEGAKETVCAPCARCAVGGLSPKQLGAKYSPILKANEALRRLKKNKASRRNKRKASGEDGVNPQHLALLSVRHRVKTMKSRVPKSPVPEMLNWVAIGLMLLLGAWGAWMGLTRR